MKKAGKDGRRGHAALEVALLSPWIYFLFAGAFDMGFYSYSLIATENAAHAAAVHASLNSQTIVDRNAACRYALAELQFLPNLHGVSSCDALPLSVSVAQVSGPDSQPAASVTVTYQTMQLIPIPGVAGRLTFTRNAQMRMKG